MAEKDLYRILEISKGADQKEIKKAFRRLAKKYHPDTNSGDASAEKKFKEINEAYAILGDEKKRKLYDEYGMMAFMEGFDPRYAQGNRASQRAGQNSGYGYGPFSGADFGTGGFEGDPFGGFHREFHTGDGGSYQEYHFSGDHIDDILKDILGGGFRKGKGQDSFGGKTSRSGFEYQTGAPKKGSDLQAEVTVSFEEAAFGCERTIQLQDGQGEVKTLKVQIPAGIDDGKKVRLKEKGNPGFQGGKNGDLLLKVHITPKQGFERKGQDVYTTIYVPFTTAALGGSAIAPTLYGRVSCQIPEGTQSGSKLRLKGKGIVSMKNSSLYGDEYVTIQVQVPKNLSPEEKNKLREFEEICRKRKMTA